MHSHAIRKRNREDQEADPDSINLTGDRFHKLHQMQGQDFMSPHVTIKVHTHFKANRQQQDYTLSLERKIQSGAVSAESRLMSKRR